MGEKVQGIRSINGRYKIDGKVKSSIGNGEAKELTCTTHGHELRREGMLKCGGIEDRGGERGGKKWDKCNSIIKKIYVKRKKCKKKRKKSIVLS